MHRDTAVKFFLIKLQNLSGIGATIHCDINDRQTGKAGSVSF